MTTIDFDSILDEIQALLSPVSFLLLAKFAIPCNFANENR